MESRLNCSARPTINLGRPGIPCRHFTGVEHCSITRSSRNVTHHVPTRTEDDIVDYRSRLILLSPAASLRLLKCLCSVFTTVTLITLISTFEIIIRSAGQGNLT